MAAPIPITVLGGYLGAGKTTLLNALLAGVDERRIGVIVNDFGELGIDAALLADRADDGLVDLPNGCVCCTLGTELGVALDALAARSPRLDQIVIEASGVADPATLAAWGTVPGFVPGGVFTLAAADTIRRQVDDRYVGGEVRRQLVGADLVVVTKPDLVGASELSALPEWLAGWSTAPVVVAGSDTADLLAEPVPPSSPVSPADRPVPATHGSSYTSWSWRPSSAAATVSLHSLRAFVDELPDTVLRAKGIVGLDGRSDVAVVQVVGRHRVVARASPLPSAHGLVVIGPGDTLDISRLDDLARTHLG